MSDLAALAEKIAGIVPGAASKIAAGELTVTVDAARILDTLKYLQGEGEFKILVDICGSDWPARSIIPRRSASGTGAVTTGASRVPENLALLMSAAPNRRPMSDGLIGVASMRTTTSSGPGSATGTRASDSSSSAPSSFTSERS